MESKVFNVEGMSCQHCVSSITSGLKELKGVGNVLVHLADKTVTVDFEPQSVTAKDIEIAIEDLGYDVVKA